MRVVRGRERTPAEDTERSRGLLSWAARHDEPALRVWHPHRQVAFGRRDTNAEGYETARAAARAHGFTPVERSVGGRAVAYTGSTLAFARFEPIQDARRGIDARYAAMEADVTEALAEVGVQVRPGEPPDSFCPGAHSLQRDGKLCGLAQRVTADAALVSGILIVADHGEIGAVLGDVYEALSVPFDPATVDSVRRAGGDVDQVAGILEDRLIGDAPVTVETLRQT
ncbi:MAG: biotin/lipoate A/B protein ligase family protein [Halodesulfurarchaeum sp.]